MCLQMPRAPRSADREGCGRPLGPRAREDTDTDSHRGGRSTQTAPPGQHRVQPRAMSSCRSLRPSGSSLNTQNVLWASSRPTQTCRSHCLGPDSTSSASLVSSTWVWPLGTP